MENIMSKAAKIEQHGCIFHHIETERPVLWITEYNENWMNKEDSHLYRIKCASDIPDTLPFDLEKTTFSGYFLDKHKDGDKRSIYFYLSSFFTDKKEREDFWMLFLDSGFPDIDKSNQQKC
jgi:hypothetical protein